MNTIIRTIIGFFAFLATMFVANSAAATEFDFATITGYEAAADNNQVTDFCTTGYKIDSPGGTVWQIVDNPEIAGVPTKVIVKAGSDGSTDFANTIFADPTLALGQWVWADTNGNGAYDPDGKDGDKQISHIIICETEATDPEPEPENKPVTIPDDYLIPVEPEVKPEPEPENKPVTIPDDYLIPVEPEVKPEVKPEPTPEPEVKPEVEPTPEVKPEVKPEPTPEVDLDQEAGDGDFGDNAAVESVERLADTGGSLVAALLGFALLAGGSILTVAARRR